MDSIFRVTTLTPQAHPPPPQKRGGGGFPVSNIDQWLSTPSGYIEGYTESINDQTLKMGPTELYDYQTEFMDEVKENLWIIHKARQVGMSFSCAAKALAKSQILDDYRAIFISIDKDEADEKIVFARELYHSIPPEHRKRLVIDNKHCLEFQSGHGRTRIVSFAQKKPRGKGRNTDVFLDEFAHYLIDHEIWVAALPIILRGGGQMTVLSTAFGMENMFYQMVTNKKKYPRFRRQEIYWWECPALCTDVPMAKEKAPSMSTEHRVLKFGTTKLQTLFESADLQDFQEEMEAQFAGRTKFYYPPQVVRGCLYENGDDQPDEEEVEDLEGRDPISEKYSDVDFFCFDDVEDLLVAVRSGRVRPNLIAGYDVGRHIHMSVNCVFEQIPVGENVLLVLRLIQILEKERIPDQVSYLDNRFLSRLPHARVAVDSTGLGVGVTDGLEERYTDRVEVITFTDPWKTQEVPEFRARMESQLVALPFRRDILSHMYSVKRKVNPGGSNFVFTAGGKTTGSAGRAGASHHGDIHWAIVLANALAPRIELGENKLSRMNAPQTAKPRKRVYEGVSEVPIATREYTGRVDDFKLDIDKPVDFRDY